MYIAQYGASHAVEKALADAGMKSVPYTPEVLPDALVIDIHATGGLLLLEGFAQTWPVIPVIATLKAEMLPLVSALVDSYVMYDEPRLEDWVAGKLTQVMRRFQPFVRDEHNNLVIAEGLVLVPQSRDLNGPLGSARLTPTEANILVKRLQHKGSIVSSDTLALRIWHQVIPNKNAERVHEHRLEVEKLQVVYGSPFIETVRGEGYILPA